MTHEMLKELDQQYHMPTYGRFDVVLEKGKGAVACDADGREYIDFGSGIGVNSLGWCDEGWVSAVAGQAAKLQHCSNLYYGAEQAQLARELCEAAGFGRVFFCNSGAEANECAIKLARKYSYDTYGTGRDTIVTLLNSFHGRTVTTLAATGQDQFHHYFYPFTEGFAYAKAGDLEDLKQAAGGDTCAILLELVQGEGGVVPLDKDYVKAVAAFCKERDILLMVDEVQTGVGRTGSLYAFQQYGIEPDVITSAKGLGGGLPIGACLCRERLGGVLSAGQHGTTYGGNPIACAAARYVLGRINQPEFLAGVGATGEAFRKALSAMPHVKEVRGLGMMLGVELEEGYSAKDIAVQCAEKGLLILTAKTLLRLLPPLNITQEERERGLTILQKVLEEAK